jgi:Na+/H+-dicarboxylate symporter
MDRRKLEVSIPVLAQINLDGNCFFLTMITLLTALNSNNNVTFIDIITIGVLVFFLSLGAPNQPGSCLIGILVILNYMDSLDLIPMAVIAEVSVGWLLNLTNVVGDLVTVADKESVRHRY